MHNINIFVYIHVHVTISRCVSEGWVSASVHYMHASICLYTIVYTIICHDYLIVITLIKNIYIKIVCTLYVMITSLP